MGLLGHLSLLEPLYEGTTVEAIIAFTSFWSSEIGLWEASEEPVLFSGVRVNCGQVRREENQRRRRTGKVVERKLAGRKTQDGVE